MSATHEGGSMITLEVPRYLVILTGDALHFLEKEVSNRIQVVGFATLPTRHCRAVGLEVFDVTLRRPPFNFGLELVRVTVRSFEINVRDPWVKTACEAQFRRSPTEFQLVRSRGEPPLPSELTAAAEAVGPCERAQWLPCPACGAALTTTWAEEALCLAGHYVVLSADGRSAEDSGRRALLKSAEE